MLFFFLFFFNDTATTEIYTLSYTLSLHDALPILTQLVRVAALELAPHGVRVNIIHPDAVFDTKLWTPEALQRSAERYGITVEEYKTRNLLKAEIRSADVGAAALAVVSDLTKTTGAQIPVDGGNDRVI